MKVSLLEIKTGKNIEAEISKALAGDMPLKKEGWQFSWKSLYKTEGAEFYKLTRTHLPSGNEGIIMLSLMNEEMLYMNNVEVAPHNYGSTGKFDYVAGCLIAFGCLKSFERGKGYYKGYLTFESKTELIPLYQEKYGAVLAMGQRMFIEPKMGIQLVEQYLNIKL